MGWLILLYFNWIPAAIAFAILAVWLKRTNGLVPLVLAIVLQSGALALHWTQWQRLAGEPDRLYVWILPTIMATASLGFILIAFSFLAGGGANAR